MIRKTLTILSLIGLLLSVAAWGVSYYYGVSYSWAAPRYPASGISVIKIKVGNSGLQYLSNDYVNIGPKNLRDDEFMRSTTGTGWSFGSPNYVGRTILFVLPLLYSRDYFILPLWVPAALFGTILLCVCYAPHRRRKRKKLGLCLKCGWGTMISGFR